jgi:hypothetical protein
VTFRAGVMPSLVARPYVLWVDLARLRRRPALSVIQIG